jgi:hypothetical protein
MDNVALSAPAKPKKRRGKKIGHVPTEAYRHTVQVLRANGVNQEAIARILRLDFRTLHKHYSQELKHGQENLIAALGVVIVNAGLAGNWRAALAFLSRFGGPAWKNTVRQEIYGVGGEPPTGVEPRARVIIVPSEPGNF